MQEDGFSILFDWGLGVVGSGVQRDGKWLRGWKDGETEGTVLDGGQAPEARVAFLPSCCMGHHIARPGEGRRPHYGAARPWGSPRQGWC